MKAAVLREYGGRLAIEDVELAAPQVNEVQVRIQAVGLCHTDETAREGGKPVPLPIVLGHEGAGIVEAVGPGVSTVRPGDHVVLSVVPACRRCRACTRGEPVLCQVAGPVLYRGTLLDGTTRLSQNGKPINHFFAQSSFAERAVVPEGAVVPVPDEAPLDIVAVLACGASTGIGSIFNTAHVEPGSSVVIIGCGGVGLSAVMAAKLAGATRIVAVDVVPRKLQWAEEFGATHCIDASQQDPVAEVQKLPGGGADYAFEFVGSEKTLNQLVQCIRVGGRAFMIGAGPLGTKLTIDANQFLFGRSLQGVVGGFIRPQADIPRFVELYLKGKLPLDRLITRRCALEEINEGFEAMRKGEVARAVVQL